MKRSQLLTLAILLLAIFLLFFSFYSTWLEYWAADYGGFNFVVFLRHYAVNFGPEAAGIALTVLILDFLNERRSKIHSQAQLKEQLILEMKSRHAPTAVNAVEKLRVHGWLEDGSLAGVDLSGARLRSANLYRANLMGTNLAGTQLQNSSLRYVNLTDAKNVTDLQLIQVKALMRATMPDGSVYDGRYNLPRDISHARRQGVDVNDAEAMATYLRISPQAYWRGQQWAQDYLPALKRELNAMFHEPDDEEAGDFDGFLPNSVQEVVFEEPPDGKGLFVMGAITAAVASVITILVQNFRR